MAIEIINKDNLVNSFSSYKEVVIIIIVIHNLIELYVNLRQLNRLKGDRKMPEFLKKLDVTEEDFQKGRYYKKDKLEFGMIVDIVKTVFETLLMVFYYQPYIWNYCGEILANMNLESGNEFYRAYTFFLIETARSLIIDTPLDWYSSFVIEEKHGFNKKTTKIFIYDLCVSLALKIGFTFPILYGFLSVVDYGGDYFFFYVQVFITIVMFVMMLIYPNFIAPLFNKFTELEDGELKDGINKLAASVNFPAAKIYIVDGSTRSSHSNAYFYGFWKYKRIVLFDTLLKQMTNEEIYAILCHEMGHWEKNHFWINIMFVFAQIFSMFYLFGFFRNVAEIYLSFGFSDKSTFIGITLFSMMYTPISFFMEKAHLSMSRSNEYEADAYANNFGHSKNLQEGLIKLNKENSSDMDPDPVYSLFHFTHPTMLERLTALDLLQKQKN